MYHELKSLKKVTSEFIQTITSMTVSTEDNTQASQGSDLLQSSCAGLQQSCRSLSLLCPPPIPTCNVHCTHVKSLLFVYPSLSWNSFRRNLLFTLLLCPSLGPSFLPCSIIPLYFLLVTVNVQQDEANKSSSEPKNLDVPPFTYCTAYDLILSMYRVLEAFQTKCAGSWGRAGELAVWMRKSWEEGLGWDL